MAQMMPLLPQNPIISLMASIKSRLVLTFWYWLTQVVLEKRPLNGSNSSSYFYKDCISKGIQPSSKSLCDSPGLRPICDNCDDILIDHIWSASREDTHFALSYRQTMY